MRCRFCHLRFFEPKKTKDLTYDEFLLLKSVLPHLKSLTLFSKFEPLMCKDFLKIFNEISRYDFEIYFSTNGTLLNEEIIDALVGRLKFLTISITGFTRGSYLKNMGRDNLELVKESIAKINRRKREKGSELPLLRISTVGMLDTIEELKMCIDFARDNSISEGIQLTSFIAYDEKLKPLVPLSDIKYFKDVAFDALDYARQQGVRLVLQSGDFEENALSTGDLSHRVCKIPWERLSLQPDGDVYPCPAAYERLGNFIDIPLLDIWTGEEMRGFRKGVNDRTRMNPECRRCVHCRHKSVSKMDANNFADVEVFIAGMRRRARPESGNNGSK